MSSLNKVYIDSIGTFLPDKPISNSDLAKKLSISEEWIELFVGNKTRHFAYDIFSQEKKYSVADMAYRAVVEALKSSIIRLDEIEFLVFSSATPDYLMPATVNLVAEQLGLNDLPTYELRSGCCGIVQAMDLAHAMISSGQYQHGMVIGADTCAKHLALDKDYSTLSSAELVNYLLFGDGAGALILSNNSPTGICVEHTFSRLVGRDWMPGQLVNSYAAPSQKVDVGDIVKEDYKNIEQRVPVMANEVLEELLQKHDLSRESVSYFMPPQLNGNMIVKILNTMKIENKRSINCVDVVGNCGNALPLFQMEMLLPKMQIGNTALGVAIESSKWLKSGLFLRRCPS